MLPLVKTITWCCVALLKASVVAIVYLRGLFKVSHMPGMSSITKNDRPVCISKGRNAGTLSSLP